MNGITCKKKPVTLKCISTQQSESSGFYQALMFLLHFGILMEMLQSDCLCYENYVKDNKHSSLYLV